MENGGTNIHFNVSHFLGQESEVLSRFENFYGKGKRGFCDLFVDTIDLFIAFLYRRKTTELDTSGKFQSFDDALRYMAGYHYLAAIQTLRSSYLLASTGYYADSATLLRSNIESFVRLKFLKKKQDVDLISLAFVGHQGINGKTFKVQYKEQFDSIDPCLYQTYRLLCDAAHNAMFSEMLKSDMHQWWQPRNPGVEFREKNSVFIVNQMCVYGLAQVCLLSEVFPEAFASFDQNLKTLFQKTIELYEEVFNQMLLLDNSSVLVKAANALKTS